MREIDCDIAVIGGGPAGLAAASYGAREGASVALFEREGQLGGILKQCIHDGFGLIRYGEKLSGPEYAHREIQRCRESGAEIYLETFLTKVEKNQEGFLLTLMDQKGLLKCQARALISACGCRERTDRQIAIHGTRPAGVFTAGQAQAYINLEGKMPARRCVILGSGDIGLIMARRLTLEGVEVVGVYEIKGEPAGLSRNIAQCLTDFSIPLTLSATVSELVGKDRLEGVWIESVNEKFQPLPETKHFVPCDTLILSVGLIPENDAFETLGWEKDFVTTGPKVDSSSMTSVEGFFSCGNSLHVNDLVDYVSESGETAAKGALNFISSSVCKEQITASVGTLIGSFVPQRILLGQKGSVDFFFRSRQTLTNYRISVKVNDQEVFSKSYLRLKPPEMEKITLSNDLFSHSTQRVYIELLPEINSEQNTSFEAEDEFVCIECPRGCLLQVAHDSQNKVLVEGNSCQKGQAFGVQQLENPSRILTSTIKTNFVHQPRLSVRTNKPLALSLINEAMKELDKILLSNEIKCGEIIVENFGGWGVDLIATADCFR